MARAKITHPAKFSDYFKIDPDRLKAEGAMDPILNVDTKLFIDPLLLPRSVHPEMRDAHLEWEKNFQEIIKLLTASRAVGDPAWKAADARLYGREFQGTCLGYGAGIHGSGLGEQFRAQVLTTAHKIVKLGVDDPVLFPMLSLFEENIGPDRISDLTTQIIAPHLAAYTVRVLAAIAPQTPTEAFRISGRTYGLPVNPFYPNIPVVLVPQDVLRELPIASDWSGIADAAAQNDEIRKELNAHIGGIWERHAKTSKAQAKAAALSSKEAFEALLAAILEAPARSYDFAGDPLGLLHWLDIGRAAAQAFPLQFATKVTSGKDLMEVVKEIVEHFQYVVEKQGGWKSMYGPNGKPLKEHYSQRLFFAMADVHCKYNNADITPEADSGNGPVDFKLSRGYNARVVVEIKLTTSSRVEHGYKTQLEAYKAGERTDDGYFVVIDVDGGSHTQLEKVLKREAAAKVAKERYSPVIVIDATKKLSASKRESDEEDD